jgi:hypothetical protein
MIPNRPVSVTIASCSYGCVTDSSAGSLLGSWQGVTLVELLGRL